MLRDSLEHLINGQDDMEVIGSTDDAAQAPEMCKKLMPDLILMDVVTKNNSNGIHYTVEIRKDFPQIKIVIMTDLPEITFADEAKKAKAHSFIKKDIDKDHLLYVIRITMRGIGIYPGPENSPFGNEFTENEIDVIRMICQGIDRDEIAKKLEISDLKLKRYITTILDKTGFDSTAKLAIFAVNNGFIVPNIF